MPAGGAREFLYPVRVTTEPQPQATPDQPSGAGEAPAQPASPTALDDALAFVRESSALFQSLADLARAEAALSTHAMRRAFTLGALALAALLLALLCFALALVIALAQWLDSYPIALALVGALLLLGAHQASARAGGWRLRVGFKETRAALVRLRAQVERKP